MDDAVFTLYQWNEERGLYEKSKDYAFVRDAEGLYTITCLHDDWSQYEEGNLYYEDTLCDVREDTVNSDGTTTEHPQYYTDYEPIDFSIDERAVTTDGQFVVVESKSRMDTTATGPAHARHPILRLRMLGSMPIIFG